MTSKSFQLPDDIQQSINEEKKLLADHAKLNHSDCFVTLVRYTIKAHVAVVHKKRIEEINECIRKHADYDADGCGSYYPKPAAKLLKKLSWCRWSNNLYGYFTDNNDFGVTSDRGYVVFKGDVSRIVDRCLTFFDYEWQEEDDLGLNGGIDCIELQA